MDIISADIGQALLLIIMAVLRPVTIADHITVVNVRLAVDNLHKDGM